MSESLSQLAAKSWVWSFTGAVFAFASTMILAAELGTIQFGLFLVDVAFLSLIVLVIEAVPSAFAIFEQQRDKNYQAALPSFYCALLFVAPLTVFTLSGVFANFNGFILLQSACSVIQRYLDLDLQARGEVSAYYRILAKANVFRLAILISTTQLTCLDDPSLIAWGSLSLGTLSAIFLFFVADRTRFTNIISHLSWEACKDVLRKWRRYLPYYPNTLLKRIRDVLGALVCDLFVGDKIHAGVYLMAMRGVETTVGQVRVLESIMSNFVLRSHLQNRVKVLFFVSTVAQLGAFTASSVIIYSSGVELTNSVLAACGVASLFVYPYVLEIAKRSDAYASFLPIRVTISLFVYIVGMSATIFLMDLDNSLTSLELVYGPVVGQSVAAFSYFLSRPTPPKSKKPMDRSK